jgi:hypothetical protein
VYLVLAGVQVPTLVDRGAFHYFITRRRDARVGVVLLPVGVLTNTQKA